jgi:hypothetical protein
VDHHPCTIPNEESNHEPARPNTKYFEPSSASFMVNYIVDDPDALLDRLAKEGVRIDPKRRKLWPLCLDLRSRRQQNRIVAAALVWSTSFRTSRCDRRPTNWQR